MMSLSERWRRWFFRRQRTEAGSIVLDRRRVYILPTRSGLLFVAVLVVMYIGAVNYNLGLGHALVFLLVGLGHNGMLYAFRNLVGVSLIAGRARPVFAGEVAVFEILIDNRRTDPRPAIHLQLFESDAALRDDRSSIANLLGSASAVVELPVKTVRRGRHRLGRLVVSTRYPLGLFRVWSYPWPSADCLVYPTPLFHPLPMMSASAKAAGNRSLPSDSPDDFAGFRRHQPGDSSRHIAWKIHARNTSNAPLLVKEFSGSAAAELWLDWAMTPANTDIESRLSILCGWALQADRAGISFGLRLPGVSLSPSSGEAQLVRVLEALALFGEPP